MGVVKSRVGTQIAHKYVAIVRLGSQAVEVDRLHFLFKYVSVPADGNWELLHHTNVAGVEGNVSFVVG